MWVTTILVCLQTCCRAIYHQKHFNIIIIKSHRIIKAERKLQDHLVQQSAQHHHHNHIPKCHTQTPLKHFKRQGPHHLPWEFIPMPNYSFSENFTSNIQPELLLVWLKSIHSIICQLAEKTDFLSGSCREQ